MSNKQLTPEQQSVVSASDAGQHLTTIVLARKLLESDPDNIRVLIDLGHACWQLARYQEAEATFNRAIELCDENKRDVIYGELGNLHRAQGNFPVAVEWYQKQIATDPHDATGYLFLGTIQFRMGDLLVAEKTLRQGLECEYGRLEEVHYTLGLVNAAQSNLDAAISCFEKALTLDRNHTPANFALKDAKSAQRS